MAMAVRWGCQYLLQLKSIRLDSLSQAKQMVLFEAVEVDYENNLLYSITYQDTGVRIRKVQIPIFSLGLNEKLDDTTYTVLDDQGGSDQYVSVPGVIIRRMGSSWMAEMGIGTVFSNEGNSSGSATMV